MTRVLSELLEAAQPRFGMTIQQLERAAGRSGRDIRLTTEILQRVQQKLQMLGLDPQDTTGNELYQALLQRFKRDEALTREALHITEDTIAHDALAASVKYIKKNIDTPTAFALKSSVAKKLLKKSPPKRAMKQLGYRSLDSMLKHEAAADVYTAAFLCEPLAWRKKLFEQYSKLQSSDFELRPVEISLPHTVRWNNFTKTISPHLKQHVIVFKELGSVVVLPAKTSMAGVSIVNMTLITGAINDIASATSYLKLQQVKPDFGTFVRETAEGEPLTTAELVDRPVPWRVVHQYYARFAHAYNPVIFEPHVQPADLKWRHPEALLSKLHPALEFWQDTRYTAQLNDKEKVSLNIFDVARNYCGQLPFAKRTVQALHQSLWQELMIRYLDHANVEHAIAGELATQPEFAVTDEFS